MTMKLAVPVGLTGRFRCFGRNGLGAVNHATIGHWKVTQPSHGVPMLLALCSAAVGRTLGAVTCKTFE
jgi:hypothetical protein